MEVAEIAIDVEPFFIKNEGVELLNYYTFRKFFASLF
jgi:hypothetical protein